MKAEELIINRADWVLRHQKYTAAGITLFFWAALLYMWQPALSLIAWALNLNFFYEHMVVLGGYRTFLDLLAFYGVVIGLLAGSLIIWAKINQWRFSGLDRRSGIESTAREDICETFLVEPESLGQWLGSRRFLIDVNEDSEVVEVQVLDEQIEPVEQAELMREASQTIPIQGEGGLESEGQ